MKLLSTFKVQKNRQAGFTLIEILLVVGILVILAGVTGYATIDAYRGYQFRSMRQIVATVLMTARQNAISNINQTTHGVRLQSTSIILFQSPYTAGSANNQTFNLEGTVQLSGVTFPYDVVFSQLSGDTTAVIFNIINNNGKTSQISINSEGGITW